MKKKKEQMDANNIYFKRGMEEPSKFTSYFFYLLHLFTSGDL